MQNAVIEVIGGIKTVRPINSKMAIIQEITGRMD